MGKETDKNGSYPAWSKGKGERVAGLYGWAVCVCVCVYVCVGAASERWKECAARATGRVDGNDKRRKPTHTNPRQREASSLVVGTYVGLLCEAIHAKQGHQNPKPSPAQGGGGQGGNMGQHVPLLTTGWMPLCPAPRPGACAAASHGTARFPHCPIGRPRFLVSPLSHTLSSPPPPPFESTGQTFEHTHTPRVQHEAPHYPHHHAAKEEASQCRHRRHRSRPRHPRRLRLRARPRSRRRRWKLSRTPRTW